MPRTWKSLPFGKDGRVQLKAPTHREYLAQTEEGEAFKPPRAVAEQAMVAITVADAVDDEGLRLPQGATYVLYRYAQGLAVTLPSGWTVYVPMEGQKRNPSSGDEVAGDGVETPKAP